MKRPDELDRVLDFYVSTLEAMVVGDAAVLHRELVRFHEQIRFIPPAGDSPIITFSGGVGELLYRLARGETLPGKTAYGDLGIDLARRIAASPLLSRDLRSTMPENLGRATVYGLTIHNMELSGATLFLPRPEMLPLRDLPIVGRLRWDADASRSRVGQAFQPDSQPGKADLLDPSTAVVDDQLRSLLELAKRASAGACVAIDSTAGYGPAVKILGERLAHALQASQFPPDRPLVLLISHNVGKTLGQYATQWGRLPFNLIVLDEIPNRAAHFASLGRMVNNLVPVSFYGMHVADAGPPISA